MDYAKRAYLKATENEQKIDSLKNPQNGNFVCYEFVEPETDKVCIGDSSFHCPSFYLEQTGQVFLYASFTVICDALTNLNFHIYVNDSLRATVSKNIVGEMDVALKRSITLEEDVVNNVYVLVEAQSDVSYTVKSFSMVYLSNGLVIDSSLVSVSYKSAEYDGYYIIYYIKNGGLFIYRGVGNFGTLSESDFSFKISCKDAGLVFSNECDLTGNNKVYLFRLDSLGNLYYSLLSDNLVETLVQTGVSRVSAGRTGSGDAEEIIVSFVKNNNAYYFTFTNAVVGEIKSLNVCLGEVKNVEVVSGYSQNTFILIKTDKSNYIINSNYMNKKYDISSLSCSLSTMLILRSL